MRRKVDCRTMPGESGCSLLISGTEDEVMTVALRHAIDEHGHADTPALREAIRASMRDDDEPAPRPGKKPGEMLQPRH